MKAARRAAETPAFAEFYDLFPRKEKRPNAFAAWKAQGCEAIAPVIMASLRRWLPEFASRPADKVPHPASWLNGKQWQDTPPSHALPSKSAGNIAALEEWQPPTKVFG